jgi:hypothetical protein
METATKSPESHCTNCNTEIGGYFGNKVYRWGNTDLCNSCGEANDPIVQMCVAQTGMTPREYQAKYRRAWND